MLKSYNEADILDGLKRLDHVFFSLPTEGGKAALAVKEEMDLGGYNLLHYLKDEYSLPLEDAAAKEFAAENLGTLWSFEDEDAQVQFHGVYNHSLEVGWHPAAYELVTRRLDEWWEENEDSIVRPVRSVVLGRGKNLTRIADAHNGIRWSINPGFGVMANTEIEFAGYFFND